MGYSIKVLFDRLPETDVLARLEQHGIGADYVTSGEPGGHAVRVDQAMLAIRSYDFVVLVGPQRGEAREHQLMLMGAAYSNGVLPVFAAWDDGEETAGYLSGPVAFSPYDLVRIVLEAHAGRNRLERLTAGRQV